MAAALLQCIEMIVVSPILSLSRTDSSQTVIISGLLRCGSAVMPPLGQP
jgi:hypothetical protein